MSIQLALNAIWVPGSIVDNRVIHLSISGIVATTGETMGSVYETSFYSRLTPLFASPSAIVALGGGYIPANTPDSTLMQLIWFYSVEALSFMPADCSADAKVMKTWLSRYVRAAVVNSLVTLSCSDASLSKKLGDLTVSRGAGGNASFRARLGNELEEALQHIQSCGVDLSAEMDIGVRGDYNCWNKRSGRDPGYWSNHTAPLRNAKIGVNTRHGRRITRHNGHRPWEGLRLRRIDLLPLNSDGIELDLRKELAQTLTGHCDETAKGQFVVIRRMRRNAGVLRVATADDLQHCECKLNCYAYEPDTESPCDICEGEGYLFDDEIVLARRQTKFNVPTTEMWREHGKVRVDSINWYLEYYQELTEYDQVIEIALTEDGKIISPIVFVDHHDIHDAEDFRGDHGRIEFYRLTTYTD